MANKMQQHFMANDKRSRLHTRLPHTLLLPQNHNPRLFSPSEHAHESYLGLPGYWKALRGALPGSDLCVCFYLDKAGFPKPCPHSE